jgi:hypothetical protein
MKKGKDVYPQFNSLEELCLYLEKKRKRDLFLFVLYVVVASLIGAGGLALVIVGAIGEVYQALFVSLGFVFFLVVCPVFVFLSFSVKKDFKKAYFLLLSKRLSEGKYDSLSIMYSLPDGFEANKRFEGLKKKPDQEEASYLEGSIKDVIFFSYEYEYSKIKNAIPYDFHGRFVEFVVPKSYEEKLLLLSKNEEALFKNDPSFSEAHLESTLFENNHRIYASSVYFAHEFMSPKRIQRVNELETERAAHLSFYCSNNRILVYVNGLNEPKKWGLSHKVDMAGIEEFQEGILLPYQCYFALLGN